MSALKKFYGRIAIITASTDGIGFSIAQRLGKEGAKVIISSRKEKHVKEAVETLSSEGVEVKGLVCHVSKAEDRKKLFEEAYKFGGLDILVSNAAVNPEIGGVLDCSETAWDKIFDVNVKSAYLLAKEAVPLLKQSKAGRIIFISSIAGYQPFAYLGAYSVSKTALVGLTKAAAIQLAIDNITVNCVAPGVVQTRFSTNLTYNEESATELLSRIPMLRLATTSDISAAVAFLASDDAPYITGETIIVAGGMAARM